MSVPARALKQRDGVPLREVADHIDRRMEGKAGSVTLHYLPSGLQRVQYGDYEDAAAMPRKGAS